MTTQGPVRRLKVLSLERKGQVLSVKIGTTLHERTLICGLLLDHPYAFSVLRGGPDVATVSSFSDAINLP